MAKSDVNSALIANLTAEVALLKGALRTVSEDMAENNNAFFLVTMALIIFLMQCGFAFLEAGAVRSKNTTNILIKNLLDSCIAILSYWAIGWALAYGHNPVGLLDPFVGGSEFFLIGQEDYPRFFFQFVFAATAATIVSGAVAERTQFLAYIVYCLVISSIVYPIVVHWGWHSNGWMAAGITINGVHAKYVDFAGSGMVHVCGGTISLVAAYIMGPRIGRFPKSSEEPSVEIQGHSVPFAALGGFLLMFCFLAFNGGSQADIVAHGSGKIVALAMVNSITAGASAGFTTLIVYYVRRKKVTLLFAINAVLAGMVAACAGCNNMLPAAAIVVGTLASFLYLALAQLLITLKIDDPLEAAPVHLGGGVTGLIGAALFTNEGLVYGIHQAIFGPSAHPLNVAMIQLLWTIVCTIAIFAWSFLTSVLLFGLLKKTGKLRVSPEVEVKGLDLYLHGESAYPLHAYGHGWDELENVKTHVYLNNNNDPAKRSRKISNKGELSLEELAAAYERRTSPEDRDRKISLYHNPRNYEHPEHHFKATHTNVVPKRNVVKPAVAIPEGNGNEHDEH
ncbi:Ammonium transporter family and Ammonium transporter AmtB-like domain-containing protein [Aphelenchoides fujianensis]|nr:Ammonium transporter family and Ammonium transporter AmtB-like domain-containing protein [Aphelenchoides fujianensis]